MDIITQHKQEILDTINQYEVTFLALFGSHARNEAKPDSDVDLLVDYKKPLGLLKFARLQQELSLILEQPVDLVSRKGMSKHLKPFILNDLQVVYEEN